MHSKVGKNNNGKQFKGGEGSWTSAELSLHAPRRFLGKAGAEGRPKGQEREGDQWSVGPRVGDAEHRQGARAGELGLQSKTGGNVAHTRSVTVSSYGAFTQVISSNPLWSEK